MVDNGRPGKPARRRVIVTTFATLNELRLKRPDIYQQLASATQ